MNVSSRTAGRTAWVAIRAMLVCTLVLGVAYPLVVTGIGQIALPAQANGSLVRDVGGRVVGSALVAQSFSDPTGAPLPRYFQPRPSAAGDGYDGRASSGSNLGPSNPDLVAAIRERKARIAAFNGVAERAVPADAVTASASGLDPQISPAYAAIQVERVARERGLSADRVRALVAAHTEGRALGFIGEPVVDVLTLNLALDPAKG
ncbi:potassium-transporting ATPase subunit C [Leucobacter sp. OAMLP11]|uniref:potassium-transporting ATPase subunit KdpC n=1 Tax=unclassified Leucobacter TaxID=2621730 RepID=UPI000C195D5B|nr:MULTISPECIES: potassium-transporting ATPase subunit KdpC [unclassified Leucobacter]PIJ42697.1 potassium-transporting ATPase subunit C [Leucobacter sp. OLES1]PII84746.1 potassium-transporting ATPase subunit C [Leucobacter sp. OLCALW19]PII87833.1 potassium-transporting ATPase subunit C [Leucobacter sp. OLTLW20]PII92695.1 potassium-transporting ATPase subunit C [Leucobacter sp. OLAS13]PII98410.1 potassium-transporting ATPase subunit C [Leucobacter sp. OLDS2]